MGTSTSRQQPSSLTMFLWLIWERISISFPNSFLFLSSISLHRLIATTTPLATVPLYTVPWPPRPRTLLSSKPLLACSSCSSV
uniref:Uncharacterized protein n=1 Tax=Oryza brachyantha TaxID=4533 RepID=J3MHF6_ORYBR